MMITTVEQLRNLYPYASGRAKDKVLPHLEKHSTHFIMKAPFALLSTRDRAGNMDVSPRGGEAGFVCVASPQTLLIPDAKGNNRLDSLTNIIETGHIGMLFLIPGIDETLRVNGRAKVRADAAVLGQFNSLRHPPASVIEVEISEVFLHCAKALMRAQLWNTSKQLKRSDFPTMGQMLNDQLGAKGPIESQAEMLKRYSKDI